MQPDLWPFVPGRSSVRVVRSERSTLYTEDGREILDAAGGAVVVLRLAVLRSTAKLQDAFEPEAFARAPDAYFTFPSHAPNRKLDHLLHTPDIEVKSAEVLRDAAGEVSDHLPLLVRFGPRSR